MVEMIENLKVHCYDTYLESVVVLYWFVMKLILKRLNVSFFRDQHQDKNLYLLISL